jgi:alkaline phosphatase D
MTNPTDFKRRTLVKALAASALIPVLGSNLIACSSGSNNSSDSINSVPAEFNHGVASGDPLTDRVIIWTRVTPEAEGQVLVEWEFATDASFANIVTNGSGVTSADVDYTVKVDVEGLAPGATYYYRFKTGDKTSTTGKTRTLPEGSIASATFAVVSCANYPAGYFNVYREVAKQELDAVLHLGDYLYEYHSEGYASDRAEEFGRVVEPTNELLSLADYRTRYAQYHRDVDLQAAHAAHPFVIVWDDHEVANDTWKDGADNHSPDTEGSFADRKMAAIQAWHEWLPVRPPASMNDIIYRRFQYGDLLDLLMLDTRVVGRDEQFTYDDFATAGIIDVPSVHAGINDSNRTLLGSEQLGWLREELTQSSARWQVLGQQVLMGRYQIPAALVESVDPNLTDTVDLAKGTTTILAGVAAKAKAPEDRTPEEQALLDTSVPYNMDAWDGYQFERDALLSFAQQLDSKLIVLAGDTHNAWASQLTTPEGGVVGAEFGCTSVSSPGFDAENLLGPGNSALFGPLITDLIDDLKYANLVGRGYVHITFTPDTVEASHRFVSTVFSKDYTVSDTAQFLVNRGDMQLAQFAT